MSQKEENNGFIVFTCKSSFISVQLIRSHYDIGVIMGNLLKIKSEKSLEEVVEILKSNDILDYAIFERDKKLLADSHTNDLINKGIDELTEGIAVIQIELVNK